MNNKNMEEIATKDVSAVVCSWNSISSVKQCLNSLRQNGVGEIILVDADSEDGTRDIGKKLSDFVLSDPRKGLGAARNIGIAKSTKKFVLNAGVDNIMPPNSILRMLKYMVENHYSGVSAVTLMMIEDKNYIAWAMNIYKVARFYPGQREVIGTPTLFPSQLIKENPYDNNAGHSDDGDLCTRLGKKGHKFAIANVICYELGSENMKSVIYRWRNYGKSDFETYSKNSPTWSFYRKMKSVTYPLRMELFHPFIRANGYNRFKIMPFLILITLLRYYFWFKFLIQNQMKKKKVLKKSLQSHKSP